MYRGGTPVTIEVFVGVGRTRHRAIGKADEPAFLERLHDRQRAVRETVFEIGRSKPSTTITTVGRFGKALAAPVHVPYRAAAASYSKDSWLIA